MQQTLQADDQGLVGKFLQSLPQSPLRQIQVSSHEWRLWMIPESIRAMAAFVLDPDFRFLLCTREFPTVEIDKMQVVASSLWIRPACLVASHPRFLKPSVMQTN